MLSTSIRRCPNKKRLLEYLEYHAAPKTTTQQIKDVAGSFLFSGEMVENGFLC